MNSGYVHTMKALDAIESWDLFMKKAFSGNNSTDGCPEELKKVGEEIVKKCGGLPLAISMVGGLLAKRTRSKSEWDKVYKEMNSHLGRNGGDLNNITSILELRYQNLPLELKACFMCLGFFKEDAIVKAKELVHIWVAQGLVAQKVVGEDDSMEEVARDYLNELIGRNMVQAKEMEYEKVKAWQMHDLLRELSIRKAKEQIDFEELRQGGNSHQHSLAIPRHRAVYFHEPNFIFSTNRNQRLRSLHAHCYENWLFVSGGPSSYWKSFELLRVLNLGKIKFRVLPKGIGELTGLRYLKMSYGGVVVSRLPRSWAKLKKLEVLVIRDSFWGIKIDKVILKMESLRHLNVLVESSEVDLGSMRNLQTVHKFRMSSSSDVQKIQGMSRVSELCFYIGETSGSLFGCLSSLENLSNLKLLGVSSWTDVNGITSLHRVTQLKLCNRFFRDTTLPVYFPPNLLHLTLSSMQLEEDPMPVLEKLPHLLSLKLEDVTNRDTTMVITSGGFPTLKVLRFQDMEDSYKMEIEESAMPVLNQFIISKCPDVAVENAPERIKSTMLHPH